MADTDENTYRLYDEVWKSEESDATSLHEVPVDYLDSSECEDTVNNAITEVFSDFLSGKRVNLSANKYGESDESHSDAEFKSLTGLAYVARYPEMAAGMSDNDWNPYGTESDSNISPRVPSNDGSLPKLSDSRMSSLTAFNPPLYSTDLNVNTPSVRMCSISDQEGHMVNINEQAESNNACILKPDILANFSSVSHVSDQIMNLYKPLIDQPAEHIDFLNKTLRNSDFETSAKSHTLVHEGSAALNLFDLEYDNTDGGSNKNDLFHDWRSKKPDLFQEGKALSGDDYTTQREQKTFPDTQCLEKVYITKRLHNKPVVDYNLLQQDLQDIQNSLRNSLGPEVKQSVNGKANRAESQSRIKILESSDSECDIIPSTTTTPDRVRNKMAWDFAADLGYHQPGDLMGDISLETFATNSHRPSEGKKSYNSDGDETRTSGSSDKVVDYPAYQDLADLSQILQPQTNNQSSFKDVDMMLFNFRNQREQIESRYQQLNNQGLAEKVCRILSSQNPQSQVNGLLSEITTQEREMYNQFPLNLLSKDFNFSAISSHLDESSQSLALLDNVRKRLDLSGLSSTDASKLADKSSMNMPGGNGFTALDGMAKFLSSQMAKALERTFNHSIEKIVPQRIVQCYPLTIDNKPQEKARNERFDEDDAKRTSAQPLNSGANRLRDDTQIDISEAEKKNRNTNMLTNTDQNQNSARLNDDSDSSTGRRREKYRPYRPAGSKEMYYTESDVASVADSVTTMESTHFGSDDARGPVLPPSALGSRQDAPNVAGIYGNRVPLFTQEGGILPPIQEKSGLQDERETESSQSYKGDKASDSLRSQGKEHNGSSDRGSIAVMQQGDGSKTQDRHGISREEVTSVPVCSELADPAETEARGIAKWANFRAQNEGSTQERLSRNKDTNSNQNTRAQVSERSDRNDYISQRSRFEEHRLPSDHYRRPTGMFLGSEYSHTSRPHKEIQTEPLSLTHPMIPDDDGRRFNYAEGLSDKREITYSDRNTAALLSKPRFYSGISDRSFRSRFGDAEKPFSPQDHHTLNKESYSTERLGALSRSHSDDDLHDPGRSAHISPLFRDALSPGLRQAIRSRSPILSRHIERSLSQPPSGWSDLNQRDLPLRDRSPPPIFLARERGQPLREITPSLQRPPISTTRSNQDRPWSPLLQVRVASPSSSQEEDIAQQSQSIHQAESQMSMLEEVSPQSDEAEMDKKPVSKRVQLLTQALTHEKELDIRPDIGSLWEQFKANNDSTESCLSSSSLDAVADLLLNPSPHLVNQCLKEREEHIIERQERAEAEREKRRTEKRLEQHHVHQSSSEEEFVAGYAELLAEKEMERMKRRMAKKKKGKSGPVSTKLDVNGVENNRDNLFSIAEDASFEQSPKKPNSVSKPSSAPKPKISKVTRQPHIIDPNMEKLRDRISKQKQKIDKHTLKEMQRIEKLKKLELLLLAKRKGEISDQTLEMQLEEISSTSTPGSDNSQEGWDKHAEGHNTTPLSDDSTTVKDSSNEMNAWKTDKEIRIKDMKYTDKGLVDKHRPLKTGKDRNFLPSKTGLQGISKQRSEISASQIMLLKLVKEGYLTAEEAYRLAVEREAVGDISSPEAGHGSSSDELHGSHHSRLHRLYSPYSRDDSNLSIKPRYVPKLKSTPSVYDVAGFTYPKSWYKQSDEQSLRSLSDVDNHNDSHPSGPHAENGYNHPQHSLFANSKSTFREKATKSSSPISRSVWQEDMKLSGPHYWQTSLPIRSEKRSPLGKSSPSSREHIVTPTRGRSSSPRHKENKNCRPSNKQGTHGLSQYERTRGSENEPPLRKETPESGGVAWHIPINLHQGEQKVKKERVFKSKKLPLQEIKLVNNTLPKKVAEKALQIEELEPLHEWPKEREVNHELWHTVDRPPGIPHELWKYIVHNDALASKVNHWEVDPLMDRVQYILNKHSGDSSTEDDRGSLSERHLSKMTLQEAFLARKQSFISKCKERQKRLALSCEHRKMQEYLRLEREALFADHGRMIPANLNAHPYSDNLYQPRRRLFSKQEMKELTLKRYKKLPEVLQKQESDKKMELCKINRLRVHIFNRKVQSELLRKQSLRRR